MATGKTTSQTPNSPFSVHGRGSMSAAELGTALAGLNRVATITVNASGGADDGSVYLTARGASLGFDFDRWPVAEAAAALARVARADTLAVRMTGPGPLSLQPLFTVRGLKLIRVEHDSHAKQELDWTGLSTQTGLRRLEVRAGVLPEGFWRELGTLKQLREVQLWWPEGARSNPGSLSGMTGLKKLAGVCLFDPIPAAFRALGRCPALEEVHVDQCNIDDTAAAGIGSVARLKNGHLWNAALSDAGMRRLCRWPRVRSLTLGENSDNQPPITAAGFKALGRLTTLERLHLQGFDHVAAAGWAVLRGLPRLKHLKLSTSPPFDVLDAVGPLRRVEELRLSHCNGVGPAGYRQLAAMPRLRSLSVRAHRSAPYYVPLDEVAGLRRLRSLALAGLHKATDAQVARLIALPDLEALILHEAEKVTDQGVARLAGLRSLRVVVLNALPKLTDGVIPTLTGFPRLDTLSLRCTGQVTDAGLSGLAGAGRLRTLHLDYARNLTGETLLRLARKLPLEELAVASSPHVTDDHLLELTGHPTLRRVRFLESVRRVGLSACVRGRHRSDYDGRQRSGRRSATSRRRAVGSGDGSAGRGGRPTGRARAAWRSPPR
nr:hypothetical protein [Limnoglobus roseus]